ncbi:hypothetical protein K8R33_00500 [archaeon]|nr:hypothetical protein [archaeon]
MADDIQFVDPETTEFQGKLNLSFREIVMRHVMKITQFASCEFRGGYWQEQAVPMKGIVMTTKTYVPDSREVYWNAIDCLYDLLLPRFDEEMTKNAEEIEKELDKNAKHFREKEEQDRNIEQQYLNEKVKIKRKLFQKLSLLLSRQNYLAGETISE